MAGIYLHIPFCKQACNYCDFHFSTQQAHKSDMITAMANELVLRKNELTEQTIETIYFGGGTPSVLTEEELNLLLKTICQHYVLASKLEITLEANPDDINIENLKGWKQAGINRLSVGIQSFDEKTLRWMNRAHTAKESLECINLAEQQGFNSFSIDLIYGLPQLTTENWLKTIETAFELNINHISAYCLTVEPKTVLAHQVKKGETKPLTNDKQAEHFLAFNTFLKEKHWEHYEISNACSPNNYAKHNTAYWQRKPYLGIGPSAHSFNGTERKWNIANNPMYLKKLSASTTAFETELLTREDQINEYLLTGLRTQWGISEVELQQNWQHTFSKTDLNNIQKWQATELIERNNNVLTLTTKGRLQADSMASDLFIIS